MAGMEIQGGESQGTDFVDCIPDSDEDEASPVVSKTQRKTRLSQRAISMTQGTPPPEQAQQPAASVQRSTRRLYKAQKAFDDLDKVQGLSQPSEGEAESLAPFRQQRREREGPEAVEGLCRWQAEEVREMMCVDGARSGWMASGERLSEEEEEIYDDAFRER